MSKEKDSYNWPLIYSAIVAELLFLMLVFYILTDYFS
jgi:hypothetical protein